MTDILEKIVGVAHSEAEALRGRIGHEPIQKPGQSKQDYGSPWPLVRAIERRWGPLTIDLAATRHNAKAPKWITPEEDSLKQDWTELIGGGIGFLNPPFTDIEPWAEKCQLHGAAGARIITLTPASIGAEWFASHVEHDAAVVGLRPRVCFEGCHNLHTSGAKKGQRKCEDSCLGCASYPKDLMLTLFGPLRIDAMPLSTWRWRP